MTRWLFLPFVLMLLPGSAQEASPDLALAKHFAGQWSTTYGVLELVGDGTRLSGPYGGQGRIEGEVKQGKLAFTYTEPDGVTGKGWFELAEDRQSFAGRWHETGRAGDSYDWTGKRLAAAPRAFHGLFETDFGPLRLRRDGDRVSGRYLSGGALGSVTGVVDGATCTFSWQEAKTRGEGVFERGVDGKSFTGKWRTEGQQTWRPWNGKRDNPRPGVAWLVVLEAHWERDLEEPEYSFGSMLDSWFERYPKVLVRHRRFQDLADFKRAAQQIAFLAEPVVLAVSSHGSKGKITVGRNTITMEEMGAALAGCDNLRLVHFGACEMMVGDAPERLQNALPQPAVPVSGYAVTVDWTASALTDFLYFDLVLAKGKPPERAAAILHREMAFAGDTATKGSPLGATHFRIRPGAGPSK